MSIGFVFPGQGSQAIGMLSELAQARGEVNTTFDEASDVLGYDLWRLVQDGPEEKLNETDKTQPAMLAAGVAVWRVWQAQGGARPAVMAGHSLGEYTALVCAEAIDFADAVRVVADRGRFMQQAVPVGQGAMAAILGLDDDKVREICESAARGEIVSAVNFNSPGQVVVAGAAAAVERAVAFAKESGAIRAVTLPVSVPSHCALMAPASEQLNARLAEIKINSPTIPVIHNADVASYNDAAQIRDALTRQLYSPVRWVETIVAMGAQGVDSIVECGPGKVLVGLSKRIDRNMKALTVYDPATLEAALSA